MAPPSHPATDDSSTEDDAASQTTEDDPQVPEAQQHVAPSPQAQLHPPPQPAPVASPPAPPNPPTTAQARVRPRYELKHTLRGHTMSISSVKFSSDGMLLASCGRRPFPSSFFLPRLACMMNTCDYSRTFFSSFREAADNIAKIWSPFSGELIRNLSGHTEGLSDISWSPNSVHLATASDDHTIRIWDVDSVCTYLNIIHETKRSHVLNRGMCGKGVTSKVLKGHSSHVFCINYNTEGTQLVSGGCEGDVRIWNAAKGAY